MAIPDDPVADPPAQPEPVFPREVGVEPEQPSIEEVEPVHLLANAARQRLHTAEFDDDQIDDWARAYVGRYGSGTSVDEFVQWVTDQEHRSNRAG